MFQLAATLSVFWSRFKWHLLPSLYGPNVRPTFWSKPRSRGKVAKARKEIRAFSPWKTSIVKSSGVSRVSIIDVKCARSFSVAPTTLWLTPEEGSLSQFKAHTTTQATTLHRDTRQTTSTRPCTLLLRLSKRLTLVLGCLHWVVGQCTGVQTQQSAEKTHF